MRMSKEWFGSSCFRNYSVDETVLSKWPQQPSSSRVLPIHSSNGPAILYRHSFVLVNLNSACYFVNICSVLGTELTLSGAKKSLNVHQKYIFEGMPAWETIIELWHIYDPLPGTRIPCHWKPPQKPDAKEPVELCTFAEYCKIIGNDMDHIVWNTFLQHIVIQYHYFWWVTKKRLREMMSWSFSGNYRIILLLWFFSHEQVWYTQVIDLNIPNAPQNYLSFH